MVDLDGFEYAYNLGVGVQGKYGGGSWVREKVASLGYFQTFDGYYRNYPAIYKYKHKSGKLQIGPEAAAESRDLPSLGVGKDGVGVVACAIVSTHEREHLATQRDLYSGRYEDISNMTQEFIDALGKTIDLVDCDSNVKKYYSELCNFWKAKKEDALCKDLDFDGVRDAREADYGLTVGDRDTKKIHMLYLGNAQAKDIYAATGDNEYIARDAEKKYGSYMKKGKDKDWAFPGRQIASQYQGLKEDEWNNIKDNQIKQLSKEYFPNSAKLNSAITQSMMTKETDLVDAHDVGGCFAVDDLPEIEAEGMTKNIVVESISEGIAKGEDGSYSGLVFKIGIRTRDNVTNDIVITGWLVDSDGNAVAKAYKYAYEINGKKELELCFEGEMLYKQGGSGYLLRYLTIESQSVNGYNALHDVRIDAGRSVQTYFASDFAPCSAYLKNQEIISSIVDEGLNLTVPVEICSNGVYCISALLKTKDGANVAESTCTTTGLGTKNITLVFPRKNIFLSKQNGPYILRKIELRDENGACIDSAWDVHATEAYSYRDFADGSETIFADVQSFSRESDLIGADGLCDALNFSFAVTNLTPSTTEYIARIYLCGTNDELVCSSAKTIVLSNSVNMVHIPFRGYEIKERNIEGPYYVSEVLIEDAGDGGVVERFNPKQILIERSLSEFGSVPVSINGEFSLAAGTRDTPFVVEVPVNAVRPGSIRASAILVSTNGTPVVAAESSREFTVGENGVLTLTFNAADINASGVRGPYMIKYLVLSSEYDGVEEIHVDDLGLGVLQRDFILYVDASKEDDSGDGFSPATAKATIHGAVRVANPFDTILVADGVYEPKECEVSGLTIRSINGAEATIIDGEDQCRCVELWGGYQEIYDEETDEWYFVLGEDSVIESFTLRNGWTRGSGAGIYGGIVRNCIITGCNAVGNEGWDESGTGGGAADATLENCIIYGNFAAGDGGGTSGCKLYNCTVSANKADNGAGGIACSEAYNSIVYGNVGATKLTNEYDSDSTWNGSVFEYSCTYPLPLSGSGNIDADPLLVNPLYGDVHLRSASLCIDAGSDVLGNLEFDFYGNSRIQGDSPEMGAIEGCFEDRLSVTATVKGVGSVSPQSTLVEPGGSVTFTARSDTRDFLAFEINGTRVSEEMRFTVDNIENDISVVAVFKPGTLYVSSSGSDDNSGLSWSHAKATIQGAIDACEDGETIFVWSGSYAPFISENKAVTIRSMYGASETVIDAKGMGACAFMGGSVGETNTVLIGFTLQNGFVSGSGGGARGGTLQDCVIVNNSAGLSGGGVLYSTATRCVISNNVIIANLSYIEDDLWGVIECCGGGAYDSLLNNCLICDNIIDARQVKRGYLGGGGICNGKLYNCTVVGNAILCNPKDEVPVDDNGDYEEESGVYTYGGGVVNGLAYNTIIWDNYINELVDNDYYVDKINCLEEGVDPMLIPGRFELSSDSVCIDAGNDQYVFVDMDVGGNKRIVGNRVDIGAYEYFEINKEITYSIVFIPNGGEGQMEDMTCVFGDKQNLTENRFYRIGYVFMGWSVSEEGDVIYTDRQEIYNLTDKSNGYVKLYAQWQPENCHFMQDAMTVKESGNIIIEILGGNENVASSVKLYLTYNTTSAADIDFANGLVWNVGAAVHYQTGLKFPLTLTWAAGEIGKKTITIPIKADKAIEDAEQFTVQLADPVGMELGETRLCTVTITDPGYAELEAKIAAGTATKAEKTAWDKLQKAKAPYIRGVADPANAGKVTGSGLCAAGKKVTLKATANKGYVFTGWLKSQIALDGDRLVTNAVEYIATTPSLVIDRTAKPAKDTATSTTLTDVNDNATFYATFITADEDKAAVGLTLNGGEVPQAEGSVPSLTTNIMCGVALNWPLASSALSQTMVKVAGLPAGLKFTAKDIMKKGSKTEVEIPANTIYGAPTAASKIDKKTGLPIPSVVKITVTTAGKSSVTYLVNIVVDSLPAWAVGNFEGFVSLNENNGGLASMSVTTAGKISGKIAYGGTNWTFKAASYDIASETVGYTNFAVKAVAASGKATLDFSLAITKDGVDYLPDSAVAFGDGNFDDMPAEMHRLPWKDKDDAKSAALIASYAGAYSCKVPYGRDAAGVTFVLDEKGAVKGTVVLPDGTKTRKATFSCNVLPNYDSLSVVIALPPDLKKGYPAVFKIVELVNCSGEGSDGMAYRDPGVIVNVDEYFTGSGATGTVSVSPKYGQVSSGKSVTITAKPAKGSVFHCWKIKGVGTDGLNLTEPTLKFVMPGESDVYATAVFATVEDDIVSFSLDVPHSRMVEPGGMFLINLTDYVNSLSRPQVTVKGLPSGLKYDPKTMTISGSITKNGKYTVMLTGTNASVTGKNAIVGEFVIIVQESEVDTKYTSISDFEWVYTSCGVEITSYLGDDYNVNIPPIIDNLPVVSIGAWSFFGCASLESVHIPDSVTSIGVGAFDDCLYLESINIPKGVSVIEGCLFSKCHSLKRIVIPEGVTSIGESAFYHCTSLTELVIPNSVTNIDSCAFAMCSSLVEVFFEGDAPVLEDFVFYDVNENCTAYVRPGSIGWGVSIPGVWNNIYINYEALR